MAELTTQYIASQIIVIFVYVFLSLTYVVKNRKWIIVFSFMSNFLNAITFILLGSYTSSAMCAISILRDIIFLIDERINGKSKVITKKDMVLISFIYSLNLISIYFTYNGPLSLLYACGSMLYTYSIWQKNTKIYRFMGIPVTLIVIVDSIVIKSVFGAILQGVVLITSCIGYFSNKDSKENKIYTLAEANYIPAESMAS
ncbi:MAG: YgjV family protein [Clostridia bacterium]|nr:YgjV family protein [Clostridia bacterium]